MLLSAGLLLAMLPAARAQDTNTLTTHYTFGGSGGSGPNPGLAQGSDGNFYGMTQAGGAANLGTVFQLTPAGVLTTLYSFSVGTDPNGGLVQGSDGNFYGTTGNTVYQINPAGVLTILYT